jgi:Na+-transporting NADH:ubiquinone oxidoreductase subunit NqrB
MGDKMKELFTMVTHNKMWWVWQVAVILAIGMVFMFEVPVQFEWVRYIEVTYAILLGELLGMANVVYSDLE